MRAELSVIIPTRDAGAVLPACLATLFEGVETGLIRELIISDGGSGDGTSDIAEEAGARLITGPPSRGGQLRRGADAASGAWLLFLHADTRLSPGWTEAVRAQMADSRPAWFRLRFDDGSLPARLVAGWANLRARVLALPYGDQGLLIARSEYDAVGGYPDIPLMEDVAMARRLGRRMRGMPATALTSAERYRRDGWLRRGARNLTLLARYFAGADPNDLHRGY